MQPEDVTVSWKMWPPRKEEKFGKWRLAVFRDMRESLDGSQLYFLYDPQEDEMARCVKFESWAMFLAVLVAGRRRFLSSIFTYVALFHIYHWISKDASNFCLH